MLLLNKKRGACNVITNIALAVKLHVYKTYKTLVSYFNRLCIMGYSYICGFSSSTRNFIGLLVKFIQDTLCVIHQYMHGQTGLSYIPLFTAFFSWSASETHLRPMRPIQHAPYPKRAPHTMCSTAQDAHIRIGQSRINNLLDFPILMQG